MTNTVEFVCDGYIKVEITDNGDGTLSFKFTQVGGFIGDFRGIYFNFFSGGNEDDGPGSNPLESKAEAGLFVVSDFYAEGITSPTEVQQGADSVSDLGLGANINPYDADLGIEIGTQGSASDDIQSVSFTLSLSNGDPLDINNFLNEMAYVFRLTSTNTDSEGNLIDGREGSIKLVCQPPENQCPTDPDESISFTEDQIINGTALFPEGFKLIGANDPDGDDLDILSLDSGGVVAMIDGIDVSADFAVELVDNHITIKYLGAMVLLLEVDMETGSEMILDKDNDFWNSLDDGDSVVIEVHYTVTDGICENETSKQTITIYGVNDCPTDPDESISFTEDQIINGTALFPEGFKLIGANDPDGDDIDILSLDSGGVVAMIDGVDVSADFALELSDNHITIKYLGAMVLLLEVDMETGSEMILDKDNDFWNSLDDGDSVVIEVNYTVTDGTCEDETSKQTITIYGVNDCPVVISEPVACINEHKLVFGGPIVLENFKLAGVIDVDGDDVDVFSLNSGSVIALINGVDVSGNFEITLNENLATLKYLNTTVATLLVDFETGTETITSTDNSFWSALRTGDSVQIKIDYTVTDGTCHDVTATQTINIKGQDGFVFEELSNLVLYLEYTNSATPGCDVVKVKFEEEDFAKLMNLVDDGQYLSFDDMNAFVDLYSGLTGLDYTMIGFSYKQGNNVEQGALGAKMAKGEGQLIDLLDGPDDHIEGLQFDDGFLSAKEGKQQNVDVVKLSDLTDPCWTQNGYAILSSNKYVDGGDIIDLATPV